MKFAITAQAFDRFTDEELGPAYTETIDAYELFAAVKFELEKLIQNEPMETVVLTVKRFYEITKSLDSYYSIKNVHVFKILPVK